MWGTRRRGGIWTGAHRCYTTRTFRSRSCEPSRKDTTQSRRGQTKTVRTVQPTLFWCCGGAVGVGLSLDGACTGGRRYGWRSTPIRLEVPSAVAWAWPRWRFSTCRRGRPVQELVGGVLATGRRPLGRRPRELVRLLIAWDPAVRGNPSDRDRVVAGEDPIADLHRRDGEALAWTKGNEQRILPPVLLSLVEDAECSVKGKTSASKTSLFLPRW